MYMYIFQKTLTVPFLKEMHWTVVEAVETHEFKGEQVKNTLRRCEKWQMQMTDVTVQGKMLSNSPWKRIIMEDDG